MAQSRVDGDLYVTGTLTAASLNVPASAVGNAEIEAQAGIDASKLEHVHNVTLCLSDHATSAATVRKGIWVAENSGTIDKFAAFVTVAAGAATTVTVDLLKNGTTVLSALPTITNADTALVEDVGTVSSATFTDGDIFEVSVTLTGANPPKGLNARLYVRERGY